MAARTQLQNLDLSRAVGRVAWMHRRPSRPRIRKGLPMAATLQAPAAFDPVKFRQTTRAQWESAAEAWDRWAPLLARWLGPSTEAMLDLAGVHAGSRVLDVAAG